MHISDSILIRAPAERVYQVAEAVEAWPELLPHYRYVRTLGGGLDSRVVEMAAWRDYIPVKWTSILTSKPGSHRMHFTHIGGITKGMEVEWILTQAGDVTRAEIVHDLDLRWPPVIRQIGEFVMARYFISNIAQKTLRRMKQITEGISVE